MRLRALQSMKEKLDQDDDEIIDEMEELLQEADQAEEEANLEEVNSEEVNSEEVNLEEANLELLMDENSMLNLQNNENSMPNLAKRLKEVAKKLPVTETIESYSPTQSPI